MITDLTGDMLGQITNVRRMSVEDLGFFFDLQLNFISTQCVQQKTKQLISPRHHLSFVFK